MSLIKGKQIENNGTDGISTANINTGALSADAAGRGKMADDYFNNTTTVGAKFSAASIGLDRLEEAVIQADGGQAFTATQSMGGFVLSNLGAPSANNDAVRLIDLEGAVDGLNPKDSAKVRAQGNINLAAPGATIDGITMGVGDRFLADQQSTTTQDGIYAWQGAAVPATRTDDLPAAYEARAVFLFIEEGTDADLGFVCTNDDGSDVVGTDDLTFSQFSGAASVIYGVVGEITAVNPGDTAAAGVLNKAARADHEHAVPAAVTASALAGTGTVGTSDNVARADHQHARDDAAQESVTTQAITGTDTAVTDTLDSVPVSAASVTLYLNGVMQMQGATKDYTISGQTITWLASTGTAVDMETSDTLEATYTVQGS